MKYASLLLMTLALGLARPDAQAAAPASSNFAKMTPIKLANGPNQVDLNGDGKPDIVFVAWRENNNAHGYSLVTFYLDLGDPKQPQTRWNLLPFFDEKGAPKDDAIHTGGGADCKLNDFRLLRPNDKPKALVTLIAAKRALGDSYADSAAVTFTVYELKHNKDGDAGEPPYVFLPKKSFKAKKVYCDVNEAFEAELGIKNSNDF